MLCMEEKRKFEFLRMPAHSDKAITIATIVLALFGGVMVVSASMGLYEGLKLVIVAIKMAAFTAIGYVCMLRFAKTFTFEKAKKNIYIIILATIASLGLCLMFDGAGGAKAWIKIPVSVIEITIQPSEFAKISAMLIVAVFMCDIKQTYKGRFKGIWDMCGFAIVTLFAFFVIIAAPFLQADFGSAVVLFLIICACFMVPQHPNLSAWQKIILVTGILGVFGYVIMFFTGFGETIIRHLPLQEYQINRILSAINPFIDQYNTGYQLINGLIAFASGGLFHGVGFGDSVRKHTNFPAANTDFILSIIVEELGIPGFLIIAICYVTIIVCLFKHAFKLKSEKGRCILVGVAMYLFIHFFFNVGGETGLIPLTGVPLLMISNGGSSTVSSMIAIGIAQAVIDQKEQGLLK